MRLTWYGTAALVLQEGDAEIAFDPFCGIPVRGYVHSKEKSHGLSHGDSELLNGKKIDSELPYEKELRRVKDVFITHGHFDHIYHIPRIYQDAPIRLRCTKTPGKTLKRKGILPEQIDEICPGMQVEVGPFTITAYPSRHCRFDLPLIVGTLLRPGLFRHPLHLLFLTGASFRYTEKGEILFYEVSCGGKRIQIMGSLNLLKEVEYPTGADLLVLPFQGRSDLEEYGLKIVQRLKPKKVVLDHYDDAFPPVSATIPTEQFEKLLWEQERIPCQAMVKGADIYEETKETLGRS